MLRSRRGPAGDDGAAIRGDGQRHDGGSVALECFFQLTCAVTRTKKKTYILAQGKHKIKRYFLIVEHTFGILPCMTTEEAEDFSQNVNLQQKHVKPRPKGCQGVGACNVPI